MPEELAHVLMEQAIRFDRTITISKADVESSVPSGVAAPQYVSLVLTASDGQKQQTVVPALTAAGKPLDDKDWIQRLREMSSEFKPQAKS